MSADSGQRDPVLVAGNEHIDATLSNESPPWGVLAFMENEIHCREDLNQMGLDAVFYATTFIPALLSVVFLVISIFMYLFIKRRYLPVIDVA
ncbi:hypothetical protein QR680_013362 [Steinernema hermaphroditum]|uniref:Uncharacterized protein n=1 Tax=Steinernema hermaphroditum TaxID=289476 RepID=A0AA39M2D8_9BILA|nr:hypothetical protein QR680_013362 [Steinernema hermaphroditum]